VVTGCSKDEQRLYSERFEDGICVLSYRQNTPPERDLFVVGDSLTFGAEQSEETYLLAYARFVGRLPDGSVVVNDFMSGQIHRFSSEGAWIGAFGRKGPGPMEFGTSFHPYILNGDIYVWVPSNLRLLRFSPEGEYLDGRHSMIRMGTSPLPIGPPEEGPFLTIYRSVTSPRRGIETATTRFAVLRVNAGLSQADTLHYRQGQAQGFWIGSEYAYQPFEVLFPAFAVSHGRPLALAKVDQYRIDFLSVVKGDSFAVELPIEGPPVSNEQIEEEMGIYVRVGAEEAARRGIRFPERLPAIRWMIWDESGRLWVEDYHPVETLGEGRHYNVFDETGHWLFSQELPHRPTAIFSDGYFLDAENNDGEPVVRFYALLRR
jgi:hypothetical protein